MKRMKCMITMLLLAALTLGLSACATTPKTASEIQAQRQEVRDMAEQTLVKVYENYPAARSEVQRSAGYAVFSNFGFKFLFMGSSNGAGVAVNNATKRETFMKMFELSPGLGFGAQKFACVFMFETKEAMESFVNSGWEFGGSTAAALQTSTQGAGGRLGATVSPGVTMYQLSETGAIVGISITGAKYYKDDELN
jgi:lipid-binding SYLF domain-containing protein